MASVAGDGSGAAGGGGGGSVLVLVLVLVSDVRFVFSRWEMVLGRWVRVFFYGCYAMEVKGWKTSHDIEGVGGPGRR